MILIRLLVLVSLGLTVFGCGVAVPENQSTKTGPLATTNSEAGHYAIGGQVIGLTGSLTLTDGEKTVGLTQNGSFQLRNDVRNGRSYQLFIVDQPVHQKCDVLNDRGTVRNSDISSVVVLCTSISDSIAGENQTTELVRVGADQTVVTIGQVVKLSETHASSLSASNLQYQWSLVAPNQSRAKLDNPNSATPSFVPDVSGSYVATLNLIADGATHQASTTVTVSNNAKPVANFSAISTTNYYTGNQIDLDATSSTSSDNSALRFEWSFANKPATSTIPIINPNSSVAHFTPDIAGKYDVQLIVRDTTSTSTPLIKSFIINSAPSVSDGTIVFSNDFNTAVPAQINPGSGTLTDSQGYANLGPDGYKFSNTFLRSATSNIVTLTLSNLPTHTHLSLDFLFAAIDSLDGTGTYPAGDFFNVKVDGTSIFRESFANSTTEHIQSYVAPSGGVLARRVDLGFSGPGGYYTDSAYDFSVEPRFEYIPHTASSVTITFQMEGVGLQTITDESWAMDNLVVSVKNITTPQPLTLVTPSVDLGYGLQTGPYTLRLPTANHGGITVRIESTDPTKVLITPNAVTEGTAFLDLVIPNGSNSATYYVAALDGVLGTVAITASSNNFLSATANVKLVRPGIMIQDLPASIAAPAANDNFMATIGVPDTGNTRVQYSQFIRIGGNPVDVTFSNSNLSAAQLVLNSVPAQSQTVTIPAGQYQTSASSTGIYFDPLDQGTTTVSVGAREYIRTTAADQSVTVSLATISAPVYGSSVTVGKDLQVLHGIQLSVTPGGPITVTVTANNTNASLAYNSNSTTVTPNRNQTGISQLIFTNVTTTTRDYYIQGRDFGSSQALSTLTVTAPGYTDLTIPVTITPSGFWIIAPTTITTTSTSPNSSFVLQPTRLFADTYAYAGTQALRGGIQPTIVFRQSASGVGNILLPPSTAPITSAVFSSADTSSNKTFQFDPLAVGETTISIDTPTGFSTPLKLDTQTGGMVPANQSLTVTVN